MEKGEKNNKMPSFFRPAQEQAAGILSAAPPAREAEEEERIEKFYKLLGNLKAVRGQFWRGAPAKKVSRESLLWKPTFELEDFTAAGSSSGGRGRSSGGDGRRKRSRKEMAGEGEEKSCVGGDLNLGL
ncbi:hypothetical protein AXF42_Ash005632 [Apostasia shenzhenica]|uniref:Uncharacterized protein n=1 Tax=Apostasia shenzhenica TaxID=1088818 RepID=A0A2I0BC05_9ASPA|nr:hypothetical protein AXF42_Ash005632 [Apostasia shenzhenica]